LERKLVIKERHEAIVSKWLEKAPDKPTLAFCCSHRHAEQVAAEFNDRGVASAVYISTTSLSERKRLIEQLEMGVLKILCVVDVLNEGADIRFIECLPSCGQRSQSESFFSSSVEVFGSTSGRHIVW
jgi:superfamily II DNA or RNA helicase